MQDKVCILVTHQLQYLSDVEHVVLMHNGKVKAQGSFRALKNSQKHSLLLHGVGEEHQQQKDDAVDEVDNRRIEYQTTTIKILLWI